MFTERTSMDRREVLRFLALVAASAVFPKKSLANVLPRPPGNERRLPVQLVAIGGGASYILNKIIEGGQWNGGSIAIDADVDWLKDSKATVKIRIGKRLCHGTGCNEDARVGKKAAQESAVSICAELAGAQRNLILACLGGGTGSGAGPLIAKWSQGLGIPTRCVLTMPFSWEGKTRFKRAAQALHQFRLNSLKSKTHYMTNRGESLFKSAILKNDEKIVNHCLALLLQPVNHGVIFIVGADPEPDHSAWRVIET